MAISPSSSQPVIIMGIDPGLLHCGWGMISHQGNRTRFIDAGTIHISSKVERSLQLKTLHDELQKVILVHHPVCGAIEESFVNVNPKTSLVLGQAKGAIKLSVALANIPLTTYAATLIKKTIVGVGRAEKQQVKEMVKRLLPGSNAPDDHAYDALAVALCHAALYRNPIVRAMQHP